MLVFRIRPLLWLAPLLLAACSPAATRTQAPPDPTANPPASPTPSPSPTPEPIHTPTPAFIPYEAPDWFEGAVLYEIYVRSFADSDGDGIGDFNGITARLDYLESLHIDVIWLMPVHPSPSVHGYDVSDYFALNPEYGTMADFRNLVDEVHARGIHIIIDFVSSHLSNRNPLFQDAYANPDSTYDDWFRFTNDANTTYEGFAGLSSMPRFNHFNPEVAEYLAGAALYWLDLDGDGNYSDGVDGFRVDNATFPPKAFFVNLRQAVKHANPQALLLGEVWVERVPDLAPYFDDQFDALFNFPMLTLFESAAGLDDEGQFIWTLPPSLLGRRLQDQAGDYPPEGVLVQFASNHDTDRLASTLGRDLQAEKFTAALTTILPETFALYYGEEIGMPGVKGGPPHWDSYRREPMDWYASGEGSLQATWFTVPDRWNQPDDGISVEEEENDPDSLLNTYRRLLELRASLPALRADAFTLLDTQAVGRKAWAIVRSAGGQVLVGIYNFGPESVEITVAGFPFSSDSLEDLIRGGAYPGSRAGEDYTLTLGPLEAVWFLHDEGN